MTLRISTSGSWADTPLRRFRWMTAATRYMDEAGVLVRTRLKEEAPVKTGRLQRAIRYSERPNRFLYGTDWPLAPMAAYREFVREAVPAEYHELVFEENARVLFRV